MTAKKTTSKKSTPSTKLGAFSSKTESARAVAAAPRDTGGSIRYLQVRVSESQHRALRMYAVSQGISAKDLIVDVLRERLKRDGVKF